VRLLAPRGEAAARFARAGRPANSTPWRGASWCALDLELTGLDPRRHEIIAVGAVPIEEGRVMLGQSLYTLVRTTQRSDPNAVLVHKLLVADLASAPSLDEAFDLILDALAGRVPVFHTAVVERAFLAPLFARRRVRLPAAADTELLGRAWLRERGDGRAAPLALARLARELDQPAEPPHHALGDALTTAKAFIALAAHLDRVEPQTVGSLVRGERWLRRLVSGTAAA
jgi:DNA polymerase III subunit epsilon